MKKILFLIAMIAVIGVGYLVFKNSQKPRTDTSKVSETLGKFQEPKIDSQNGLEVVVKIKPLICDDFCEEAATFDVSFTTHEGDLNFDLVKASTLEVDGEILPTKSWDGGSGGHHLNGTLTFPRIEKQPSKMILRMINIAGANRTFTWE
ncbi:MAG: hypothetical protein AAB785_01190 [Patescibacteria group bacterium]